MATEPCYGAVEMLLDVLKESEHQQGPGVLAALFLSRWHLRPVPRAKGSQPHFTGQEAEAREEGSPWGSAAPGWGTGARHQRWGIELPVPSSGTWGAQPGRHFPKLRPGWASAQPSWEPAKVPERWVLADYSFLLDQRPH